MTPQDMTKPSPYADTPIGWLRLHHCVKDGMARLVSSTHKRLNLYRCDQCRDEWMCDVVAGQWKRYTRFN